MVVSDAVAFRYEFTTLSGKKFRPKFFKKSLTLLPSKDEKELQFHEAMKLIPKVGVPVSLLAWKFSGVKFVREIPEDARVSFVWLDDVNGIPTTLHVYDDENGFRSYGDFVEAWSDLGDVVVGFDLFRHQFYKLAKVDGLKSEFNEYHIGRNTFYGPRYKLAIDLTFFIRLVSGKRPHRFVAEYGIYMDDRVSLARQLYEFLDVPTIFRVLADLLPVDRNFMQLAYQDNLKAYILHAAYLREGYLVAGAPEDVDSDERPKEAYVNVPGFYRNMVEYDVSSAYPTTVMVVDADPFGVRVLPRVMSQLLTYKQVLPDGFARDLVKKFSVALVGMLKYQNDRFQNVFYNKKVWLSVINGFYDRFKGVLDKYDPVWSRVDALIVPAGSDPPNLGILYKFGVKHHYEWLAIYENDHLLGLDPSQYDLVKKGFDFSTPWGNAPTLPIVFSRSQQLLEAIIRRDPEGVLYGGDLFDLLRSVVDDSLSSRPEDYVIAFLKSEKEVPNTAAKQDVFKYLQPGYNRGVVCKDGFNEPETVSLSDIDYRFYVRGIVQSLVQYFPPDRWDPVDVVRFVDEYVRENGGV